MNKLLLSLEYYNQDSFIEICDHEIKADKPNHTFFSVIMVYCIHQVTYTLKTVMYLICLPCPRRIGQMWPATCVGNVN